MGLKFSDHVVLITRPREASKPLQRANAFVIRQTVHSPLGGDRQPLLGTDKKPLAPEPHLDLFGVDPSHGAQGDPKHNHVESFVKPYFQVRKWTGDPSQTVGYEVPSESTVSANLQTSQERIAELEAQGESAASAHEGELATRDQAIDELKAKHADEVGELIAEHGKETKAAALKVTELEDTISGLKERIAELERGLAQAAQEGGNTQGDTGQQNQA
jgi:hypothetical protein